MASARPRRGGAGCPPGGHYARSVRRDLACWAWPCSPGEHL